MYVETLDSFFLVLQGLGHDPDERMRAQGEQIRAQFQLAEKRAEVRRTERPADSVQRIDLNLNAKRSTLNASRGAFFIDADELIRLKPEEKDELFATFYTTRSKLRESATVLHQ